MIYFYMASSLLYTFMTVVWIAKMYEFRDHVIAIHYYILATIIISLFKCLFSISFFNHIDEMGTPSSSLLYLCLGIEVARNTFSRVVALVVALGYGIVISSIKRYQNKIFIISFLYTCTLCAYLGILYSSSINPVLGSIIFIISIPNTIFNFIFCYWIYMGMKRTLGYLKRKEQNFKHGIIQRVFTALTVCIVITALMQFAEILASLMLDLGDTKWKYKWIWETSWFWVFTAFVIILMNILMPNSQSDMLTHFQEILDETLTENHTEDLDHDPIGHIGRPSELGTMELHEFGNVINTELQGSHRGPDRKDSIFKSEEVFSDLQTETDKPDLTLEEFGKMKRRQMEEEKKEEPSEEV